MSDIKLSICVPTFNRAQYLTTLLEALEKNLARLPFRCEVIVSDNASSDETHGVVTAAESRLPVTYMRQSENIGALRNIQGVMRAAKGTYAVYLADDDRLQVDGIISAIALLDANPNASALYAPWKMHDLHLDREGSQFYQQPENVTIPQGNYAQLLMHVLDHKIFSEISIVRSEILKRLNPMANDLAFWAFTVPCEYLGGGDVIYAADPFYISITRHFNGDNRAQLGAMEVQSAWDKYRGGLEYMLGLARKHGGLDSVASPELQIHGIVLERMLVALHLRISQGSDPVETYALAARLRGLGLTKALPIPMEQIRLAAAIKYICVTLPDMLGAQGVAIMGNCPDATFGALSNIASVPIRMVSKAEEITQSDIVFNLGSNEVPLHAAAVDRALVVLTEAELMQKFA
ncbi:MAG: glycosyltransferase family 2 protein [Rhodobacteraceae bacterium]|nr:glycosyltransferase family 2 protein [Paracoccaceae bacterium]